MNNRGFDLRKFGITVLSIIILMILAFVIYYSFFNKKTSEEPGGNGGNDSGTIIEDDSNNDDGTIKNTVVTKVDLDENGKYINMTASSVIIQNDKDSNLYVNEKKIDNVKALYAYFTDQIILFTNKDQCGEKITYIIDNKANPVSYKDEYQIKEFSIEESTLVAKVTKDCSNIKDIKLIYDGKKIEFK